MRALLCNVGIFNNYIEFVAGDDPGALSKILLVSGRVAKVDPLQDCAESEICAFSFKIIISRQTLIW